MASAARPSTSFVITSRLLLGAACLASLLGVWDAHRRLHKGGVGDGTVPGTLTEKAEPVMPPAPADHQTPASLLADTNLWAVLEADMRMSGTHTLGPLSKRFRLAGTFVSYASETEARHRAILDEPTRQTQHIVAENDTLDDIRVEAISDDHIVLRPAAGPSETLWMSFATLERAEASPGASTGAVAGAGAELAGSTNRFGRQVQDNRWVVNRKALLDYYQELMDEPERLVAVYDALKPLYDPNQRITGYTLDPASERDFFKAVGMKPGDVVRSVNSLPMTSRRRAEFFINEFARTQMNTVVMEVDRDGQRTKLIYEIR